MSKHLLAQTDYDRVRAERRKLKGRRIGPPRGVLAVAASALPDDVLRDIETARVQNEMAATPARGSWSPLAEDVFRR